MSLPRPYLLAGLAVIVGLVSACQHVDEQMAANEGKLRARWQQLAAEGERPVMEISWPDAVHRLETGNLKLRKARENVRAAREGVRQLPRSYIPELTLNIFANPTFDNLGNGDLGNTYLFLGSLFSLPSPVHYRAAAMQAQLRYLEAQIDCESLRRDLQVKLYKLFRKAARLTGQDRHYAALHQLDASGQDHPYATQLETMAAQSRKDWETVSTDLGELFSDYTQTWKPAADARLPDIDYASHPPPLDGRSHFAGLQLTKAALQLVVIEAQRQGMLAGEWPHVSVLLTAPPIYQRSSGHESYLSLSDVRISSFVAYSTDFRGVRSLNRKQAARRAEITKHELDVALQATLVRLRQAVALSRELQTRVDDLQQAARHLRKADDFSNAEDLDRQAADMQDQLDDLNLSLWVLDDPRWHHPS